MAQGLNGSVKGENNYEKEIYYSSSRSEMCIRDSPSGDRGVI